MKKFIALLVSVAMILSVLSVAGATSIKINTDKTYEGEDQAYQYKAYKIFDAQYETLTGTGTQEEKDPTYTPDDAKVAYFMKTGNPWISTIQGLTDYFKVTPAADGSGYTVVAKEAYNSVGTAKTVAAALKNALNAETNPVNPSGDYAAKEITAGGDAVTVEAGYYLILSDTATNLALVTTDVTLVEKNEYPHILKEFSNETKVSDFEADDDENTSSNDTVQIGDTVSYTLTITIPTGANQEMVITDTFGSGLEPVLADGKVKVTTAATFEGTPDVSAPAGGKFTITLSAEDVIKNVGDTVTFVYEAVVTKDAWYQTEVNKGELKYGNNYDAKPDQVDSKTYNLTIQKKSETESGEGLKGAKFELYRTDSDHNLIKAAVDLVALTDADLTAARITKAADTVYYRVADKDDDADKTTTIDMTDANDAVIYGLDGDSTYFAREILAPTGYNILTEDVQVVMNDENQIQPIVNNAGSVLPSTGGVGTTIFYILGGLLVIGAGVVLVSRRRMNVQ